MTTITSKILDVSRLPLPDFREDMLHYTQKKTHRREDCNRFRPPKHKSRYDSNFNRSYHAIGTPNNNSNTVNIISFRSDGSNDCSDTADLLPEVTSSILISTNETFFEQNFIRLSKIGEGSFGEVFKVRSKEDGCLYAIKMSKQMFRGERNRIERLEEVRRCEQFSGHENCIRFYRAWEQDHRLFMQMELCRENLEAYLFRRKHIPEPRIWSILLDLLLALKSLHDRNLIHMDIKLDNVLIDDDEICKLADFGLVVNVERANRFQTTEGDSRYIAPEIMRGKFSKAADIFSLGIAMLELSCFLELPANGTLWQQLRNGLLPVEFLNNVSLELQNVIREMMSPNPINRPTVDELLTHKKFIALLQRRQQWHSLRRVRRTIRRSRSYVWSKMCNFASRFFVYVFHTLQLHKSISSKPKVSFIYETTTVEKIRHTIIPQIHTELVGTTPSSHRSGHEPKLLDVNDTVFDTSVDGSPGNFNDGVHALFNSTPLNGTITPRLTKTAADSIRLKANIEHCDDEEKSSNFFIRRPGMDSTSLRRKLFEPGNEK